MNQIQITGLQFPASGTSNTTAVNTTNHYAITSSGTIGYDFYHEKTLVDVRVTEETIELKYIKRAKATYTQTSFTIAGGMSSYTPDLAIKEIYGVRDGKLTLLKTVNGRVHPPYEVSETLEFDDEIDE